MVYTHWEQLYPHWFVANIWDGCWMLTRTLLGDYQECEKIPRSTMCWTSPFFCERRKNVLLENKAAEVKVLCWEQQLQGFNTNRFKQLSPPNIKPWWPKAQVFIKKVKAKGLLPRHCRGFCQNEGWKGWKAQWNIRCGDTQILEAELFDCSMLQVLFHFPSTCTSSTGGHPFPLPGQKVQFSLLQDRELPLLPPPQKNSFVWDPEWHSQPKGQYPQTGNTKGSRG